MQLKIPQGILRSRGSEKERKEWQVERSDNLKVNGLTLFHVTFKFCERFRTRLKIHER